MEDNRLIFNENYDYEEIEVNDTDIHGYDMNLKNFDLHDVDGSIKNQRHQNQMNLNNWDSSIPSQDNIVYQPPNTKKSLSGINQIANVFPNSNHTEEDNSKLGAIKSVFGSIIYSHNSLKNS